MAGMAGMAIAGMAGIARAGMAGILRRSIAKQLSAIVLDYYSIGSKVCDGEVRRQRGEATAR